MNEPAPLEDASRLNRAWRVFATGFAFTCFGLGAMLMGFTVWPLLRLTAASRARGIARVQRAVSRAMGLFVWLMKSLGLLTYEVRGREQLLVPGRFVVANHPTLIDVVFLVSLIPEVDCIVKQALWRNPFLRWPVSLAGYISNTTGEGLVAACAAALGAGHSLVVFPEGTRTRIGQPLNLQRGAAQIALAAHHDLHPVTITCEPITLFKGNPWWRVPRRRPHWVIAVGEPLAVATWRDEAPPLAARHLTQALTQWFDVSIAQQLGEMRPQTRTGG